MPKEKSVQCWELRGGQRSDKEKERGGRGVCLHSTAATKISDRKNQRKRGSLNATPNLRSSWGKPPRRGKSQRARTRSESGAGGGGGKTDNNNVKKKNRKSLGRKKKNHRDYHYS